MRAREFLLEYSREATAKNLGEKIWRAAQRDGAVLRQIAELYNEPDRAVNLILELIEKRDPTTNKTYTPWLARMYANGGVRVEDLNFNDVLSVYDQAKRRKQIAAEHADINRFKTWQAFADVMDTYMQNPDIVDQTSMNERARGAYKRFLETGEAQVLQVMDETACVYYGQQTKWCTSATKSENMSDWYLSNGDIWVVIPTAPAYPGEKYQIFLATSGDEDTEDEIMDQQNHPVTVKRMYQRFPETMKQLSKMIPVNRIITSLEMANLANSMVRMVFRKMEQDMPDKGHLMSAMLRTSWGQTVLDESVEHMMNIWSSQSNPLHPESLPVFVHDMFDAYNDMGYEWVEAVLDDPERFGLNSEELDQEALESWFTEDFEGSLTNYMQDAVSKFKLVWQETGHYWVIMQK